MPKEAAKGRREPGRGACSGKQLLKLSLAERTRGHKSRRSGQTIDCTSKMLAVQQLRGQMGLSLGARDVLDHIDLFSCAVVMLLSAWFLCCP